MSYIKNKCIELFKNADININGKRPWDIQVHNDKFYSRLFFNGTIALGESYVDGWWDCKEIDQLIYRILKFRLVDPKTYNLVHFGSPIINKLRLLAPIFRNMQTRKKAAHDVKYHYNLGNDLFEATLDKNMNYSSGYWKDAKTLDQAQIDKMDLICKKLKLKKGMSVLEIGCGWGGFAKFASDKYGVKVTGITLSENQRDYAVNHCKGSNVKILLQDYRELSGNYDRVVSIEMFEHVGPKNHRVYMETVNKCLKKDGLFLIQFDGKSESINWNDAWVEKYLFPGTVTPSAKQVSEAIEELFFIVDWEDFTKDYHKTMICWHDNFNKNWDNIKDNYDERFYRLWNFYLLCCPATALANTQHLWQIVFVKVDSEIEYKRANL